MARGETIIEILSESARMLKEKGWSRYAMARDVNGNTCALNSNQAVSYCLWASVVKGWRSVDPDNEVFYYPFFERKFHETLELKFGYPFTVTRWNDEVAQSLEDVTTFLDDVIATIPPDAKIVVPARAKAKGSAPGMGWPDTKMRADESGVEPQLEPAFLVADGIAAF